MPVVALIGLIRSKSYHNRLGECGASCKSALRICARRVEKLGRGSGALADYCAESPEGEVSICVSKMKVTRVEAAPTANFACRGLRPCALPCLPCPVP